MWRRFRLGVFVTGWLMFLTVDVHAQAAPDWSATDRALGRAGTEQQGGVHKFSFPRSDLSVTVGDVTLKPALALGSWVAFRKAANGQTMAMGDLVLTADEVAPVMAKLQQGGVEQSALHNHLIGETPPVMYMHIMAKGDAAKIAQTIHDALAGTRTPMEQISSSVVSIFASACETAPARKPSPTRFSRMQPSAIAGTANRATSSRVSDDPNAEASLSPAAARNWWRCS